MHDKKANNTRCSVVYVSEIGEGSIEDWDMNDVICRLICSDNGIGISEAFLKHIYEPFARADDDRVRLTKGTGLGMPIVKEAVEAMGGSIHIDSMIDVGTTVTVMIKLQKNITKG